MNSTEIKALISRNSSLFWYVQEESKEDISPELLTETILNYGDFKTVTQLFEIMGIREVADIFFKSINSSERSKGNYHELTLNYFTLLFGRYAS